MRTLNQLSKEEESDIRFQNEVNKKLGTGEYKDDDKIKAEFGLGTAVGLGGQIFGSLMQMSNAKNYINNKPVMPNFYRSYGLDALSKIRSSREDLKTEKQYGKNLIDSALRQEQQTETARINSMGGSLNLRRALRTGSKLSMDKALADGYTSLEGAYANKLAQTNLQESNMLAERDEKIALGETQSFRDKSTSYDDYFSAKSKTLSDLTSGVMNVGRQLNVSDYLSKSKNLFYGPNYLEDSMDNIYSAFDVDNETYTPWQFTKF
jgi:hypothetical protein